MRSASFSSDSFVGTMDKPAKPEVLTLNGQSNDITLFEKKFHRAEIYLIVTLLVFGISTCLLLPVSAGYDEETHLLRVWQMSAFTFIPNDTSSGGKIPFPAVYWEMSYRRPFIVRPIEPDFWKQYGSLPIDAHDYIYGSVDTRSRYSPPLFLPQALVMRYFGQSNRLPALAVFYLCRLIQLLSYILLTWFAVRIIPYGKWALAILATSPVAILQASTISADAITNGIGILFIAGTLCLATQKELRWKEWLSLAALFLILFWGKLNIVPLAILPFLLIRPRQFKMRFGYSALVTVALILCGVEVLGWNMLASRGAKPDPEGVSFTGQIKFIAANPIKSSIVIAKDALGRSVDYFQSWIAIYGYNYWPVPAWTYYLYIAGLLTALFIKDHEIDRWFRIALVIVFAISYVGTIISLYVAATPVGSNFVEGVQGRYFVTVMPLLFLALVCLPTLKRIHIPALVPIALSVASLAVYMVGMYLSYHVVCGSQFYQPGLCYQPNYKNWAPDENYSAPVSGQLTIAQEIVPECNGMAQLRVWINAANADPEGKTEFILSNVNQKREITNVSVLNSKLPNGDWYPLNFQPDWASDGGLYLLTISAEKQSSAGPRIAYSLRQEYPAGKLYENNQPVNKDLIFQTGCIAGWDKMRLTGAP
jgi:uncharacterized membrane protein